VERNRLSNVLLAARSCATARRTAAAAALATGTVFAITAAAFATLSHNAHLLS
jgi:hypothetical protein